MYISHKTQHQGFTLVEALVAITILLLVVIGPMTAAQKGTQNAYYASEQLTAVFLAQEAIEAVRELRDRKALDVYHDVDSGNITPNTDTKLWATNIVQDCSGSLGCKYDSVNGFSKTTCTQNGMNECPVFFDSSSKTYNQDSNGNITPFYRSIRVEDMSGIGIGPWHITSNVSWKNERVFSGSVQKTELQTWIYDQYERYE